MVLRRPPRLLRGPRGGDRRPDSRPLRRALGWILGTVLALVVVLGLFGAVRMASVARDVDRASTLLRSASDHIELGQLAPARTELADAQRLLSRANGRLYNHPSLQILGSLPVARDNLAALRDVVGIALRMTDGGGRLLRITAPLESPDGTLEVPLRGGSLPLEAVRQTQVVARELADVLPSPSYHAPADGLIDPVRRAQDIVYAEAGHRRLQLDAVARGLELLTSLAGDGTQRRYLIAVANTAEMRGAGGMILSYGILESHNGTFDLGEFGGIDDLLLEGELDPELFASLPRDYLERWEGLQPTQLWRNTTLHPDFAFDARVMEVLFTIKTGLPVDGVIQIDPAGLAAILAGTGPVTVEGLGAVDATNVVDVTLNRAYIDFPDRDQRQELLGDVAEAAFDALVSGEFGSLRPLGEALYEAAQQRHIIVRLNDAGANQAAASFEATGALPGADAIDHLIVTVQNFSKNKLDYYLDTSVALTGVRPGGAPGTLQAVVTVANTAPTDGVADYVFGPNDTGEVAGLYRGVVSLYLPTGTALTGGGGEAASMPTLTSEAGRTVVGFDVEVPAGESRTVTLELTLAPRPAAPYQVVLAPVPRVRPTVVSVDIEADGQRVERPPGPLLRLETLAAG